MMPVRVTSFLTDTFTRMLLIQPEEVNEKNKPHKKGSTCLILTGIQPKSLIFKFA